MYAVILSIHSWLRWIVLLLALAGLVRALLSSGKAWSRVDERIGLFFLIGVDTQLLLGIVMYAFLSPSTHTAFQNFGAAMKDPSLRFWAVEHTLPMLAAVVVAHLGRVRGKRLGESPKRHRAAVVTYVICLGLVALGMPWPWTAHGRPFFRLG